MTNYVKRFIESFRELTATMQVDLDEENEVSTEYDLQHIKEELADVLVYSQNLLDKLELDADEIVNMKMKQNEAKYPVDKAKGNAMKYTEL